MKLRSMYPGYIYAVEKYFKKLLAILVPLQVIYAYFVLLVAKTYVVYLPYNLFLLIFNQGGRPLQQKS